MMFSVQSGSPFSLKKKVISDTFFHFGVITIVFFQTGSNFGCVNFRSYGDRGEMPRMSSTRLSSSPIARSTPSWALSSVTKILIQVQEPSFLLGEVHHHQGVIREVNVNCVQNVVVSFKDSLVVIMLGGTKQKILYAEHEVTEVSREAVGRKGW